AIRVGAIRPGSSRITACGAGCSSMTLTSWATGGSSSREAAGPSLQPDTSQPTKRATALTRSEKGAGRLSLKPFYIACDLTVASNLFDERFAGYVKCFGCCCWPGLQEEALAGGDNAARVGQAAGGVGDWNSLAISFPKLLHPMPRPEARRISNT